jgi:hypothetical protein
LDAARIHGSILEERDRGRRGHREDPVRRLHHAAADIDRRHDDLVRLEPLEREDRTDDIDDRIERANFMEMDLLHRRAVDGGFGLAQPAEHLDGFRLTVIAQRGSINGGEDVLQVMVLVPGSWGAIPAPRLRSGRP